jgi:hypothetical protein
MLLELFGESSMCVQSFWFDLTLFLLQLGDGSTKQQRTPVGVVGLTSGVSSISLGSVRLTFDLLVVQTLCYQSLLVFVLLVSFFSWWCMMPDAARKCMLNELWDVHSIISRCVIQSHTCAVLVGGAVRCWGYNEYGQVMLLELFGESSMCVQPFRFDLTFFCRSSEMALLQIEIPLLVSLAWAVACLWYR